MRKILLIFMITILLTGCPYKADVQQGNIIDKNVMAQLHLGLSKSEVSSILGKPLLDDMFNTNTWTYVYTKQISYGKMTRKRLILEFEDNRLAEISS